MADSPFILDVGDAEFEAEVLARSHDLPVVVDFWAPWCGPCRALGPILERVADEFAGAFLLVKVNVDEAQQVAERFGVRSIPLVISFRDGEPAGQFVGAKPEGEIRRFVTSLVPSEAERLARAGDLAASRDPAAAETHYRNALALDTHCAAARLGLARLLAGRDEPDPALELLEGLIGTPAEEKEADRLAAALRTAAAAGADGPLLHRDGGDRVHGDGFDLHGNGQQRSHDPLLHLEPLLDGHGRVARLLHTPYRDHAEDAGIKEVRRYGTYAL